jgi:hypothetical protein
MALTQVAGGMLAGSITSSQISSVAASTLTGTQTLPKGTLPTGSVLQVVNGFTSTSVTSTAIDTWVDIGLTATITPTSASSKIMVIANICGMVKNDGNAYNRLGIQLLRGSTVMGIISLRNLYTNTTMQFSLPGAMYSKLDSPATTSATTYKVQFLQENPGSTGGVSVQKDSNSGESQIFLMEIAA